MSLKNIMAKLLAQLTIRNNAVPPPFHREPLISTRMLNEELLGWIASSSISSNSQVSVRQITLQYWMFIRKDM